MAKGDEVRVEVGEPVAQRVRTAEGDVGIPGMSDGVSGDGPNGLSAVPEYGSDGCMVVCLPDEGQ